MASAERNRKSRPQTMATKCRRSRTKFTEEQLKILINAFNQKPYPGYAVKQRLALEVNTEESRIQIWFQNRRARHGFPKRPEKNLDSSQDPAYPEENIQGVRDRRCRTSYTSSQLQTLMNAFMENPYPGIDSREQLAEAIGVPESRVQIWFQNRRSRLRTQKKREHKEASDKRQNQGQDL
ncbi:double homeobox protein A [Hippopotamus amphibius kiboko]|uniref:double homeobox protein A n=1 Tax=Hippopotamus amphibius kiboko TaxID=575201 RepID=UPI002592C2E2|nr:double homeobox protein A [Hippopotamus amphibius kiboko]